MLLVFVFEVVLLPPPSDVMLPDSFPPSPRKPTLVSAVNVDDTCQLDVWEFSVDDDVSMALVCVDPLEPPDDPPALAVEDVPCVV